MAINRILQSKTTDKESIALLWESHKRYNELLAETIKILFKLRRGEYKISKTNSKATIGFVKQYIKSIILKKSPDDSTKTVSKLNEIDPINLLRSPTTSARSERLQSFQSIKEDVIPLQIPGENSLIQCRLMQDAFTILRSYYSIKHLQDKSRAKNIKEQHASPISIELLNRTKAWENKHGKINGRRRLKWYKYYQYLTTVFPDYKICDKTKKLLDEYVASGYKNFSDKIVIGLLRDNPKIKEFDQAYYNYKNSTRSPRPATFTLPHYLLHPMWVNYSRSTPGANFGITKVNDRLSVQIKSLLTLKLHDIPFDAGTRLDNLGFIDTKKGNQSQAVTIDGLTYKLQGVKVRFKIPENAGKDYVPTEAYLDHILELDAPKSPKSSGAIPANSFIVAVDLGWTNPAYCVRAHYRQDKKLQIIDEQNIKINNKLSKISKIRREVQNKSKETAQFMHSKYNDKKATSKSSCTTLWRRYNNHVKDYVNQLAHKIVDLAKNKPANIDSKSVYIVIEDLRTLTADPNKSAFYNNRVAAMVCGKIKAAIEQQAAKYGIAVKLHKPSGSSQVCSHCQNMGIRYNIEDGNPVRTKCGRLFACGTCGKTAINSDKNGAVNIMKIAIHTYDVWLKLWKAIDDREQEKKKIWKTVRPKLMPTKKERILQA